MIDNNGSNIAAKNNIPKAYQAIKPHDKNAVQNTPKETNSVVVSDQVSISYESTSASLYDYDMSLEKTAGDGLDLLRGLVLNIFKEQGLDYKFQTTDGEIDLETLTPEKAQELVADDGYFGVEKTAERIFNFAVGIAGGDPARLDAIKEGVDKGFQEALKAFGGELPQISYDTYDTVMNKLDDWAEKTSSPES